MQQDIMKLMGIALIPTSYILSVNASIQYAPQRSLLLQSALAWGLVTLLLSIQIGVRPIANRALIPCRSAWFAGAVFALGQICQRVAGAGGAVRWTWSLLPVVVYILQKHSYGAGFSYSIIGCEKSTEGTGKGASSLLLGLVTISGIAILGADTRPATVILGITATSLTGLSFLLFSQALESSRCEENLSQPTSRQIERKSCTWVGRCASSEVQHAIRDMSAAVALLTLLASLWIERPYFSPLASIPFPDSLRNWEGMEWTERIFVTSSFGILVGSFIDLCSVTSLITLMTTSNAFDIAIVSTGAIAASSLVKDWSTPNLLLLVGYTVASILLARRAATEHNASHLPTFPLRSKTIALAFLMLTGLVIVCRLLVSYDTTALPWTLDDRFFEFERPLEAFGPVNMKDKLNHPIEQLVNSEEKIFQETLKRQSKTLSEAVVEYRRRYGIPPPPKFDVWYNFAKERNVQLIDEFDSIHEMFTPFWALDPAVIKSRVAEVLGFDNSLLAVLIRGGQINRVEGSNSSSMLLWHEESLYGMMQSFAEHLPDMDLAFNLHDEPRVIVPHDTLSKMVKTAKSDTMPAANNQLQLSNEFTSRPRDMSSGRQIPEMRATRFNRFARQHTWSHSRLSCSSEAPSRDITDSPRDNITGYAAGELGFIYNTTAFSDICQTPSLRATFGFFDRPNVFNIIQDLVPIFSQSKISSFQDILYPSPWYWSDKVPYEDKMDPLWDNKNATIYWRGSTTGGFSRKGGWRRQHRQRVVSDLNARNEATILSQSGENSEWLPSTVQKHDYSSLVDVAFSHIGQCDPADCRAQQEFFRVVAAEPQEYAWGSRLLLDMDGNAFSGRFISFLRSRSLVLKMSLFREWHAEWIRPWVHYVPLSLRGDEWLECIRFLVGGEGGDQHGAVIGKRMAQQGRTWSSQALRKEDMETWLFRLLLEYGRLIDDRRQTIGFVGY